MRQSKASASAMTVALARAHLHWLGAIDDPHAGAVLTRRHRAAGRLFRQGPLAGYGRSPTFGYIACRTRFFDDSVRMALAEGVTQVVLLGAGYDSRPLRVAGQGVRYFEVDHPATQADKRRRLLAPDVTYVGSDLTHDDFPGALRRSGYDGARPSIILAEGLTMYLDQATNERLFTALAGLAVAGSRLAVDFAQGGGSVSFPSQVVASAIRLSWRLTGEDRYDWADGSTALGLLRDAGWAVTEAADGPTLADRYLHGTPLRIEGISPSAFCVLATRDVGGPPVGTSRP